MALQPCDSKTPGQPGMAVRSSKSTYAVRCMGCVNCRPPDNTVMGLQAEIAEWADSVFPDRTVHDILHKLMCEELPEFCLRPVAEEVADVILLVLDLGNKLGIDVQRAIRAKLAINRKRRWVKGANGTMHHVRTP